MDTEFDKNALKAVLFATRSRKEIEELGIKADRAVTFLRNTISISEECENALLAAEDMLNIRLTQKKERIDQKIHQIDEKISTLGDRLPKVRKEDLLVEKEALIERAENVNNLQMKEDKNSRKRYQQCKRRLAKGLLEENRVKRRKISQGAPRALDTEDEEFIQKAIEDKSTAHGRRHDAVLYLNNRVKKKDFLSIANYSLLRRGKKLIKSATTVLNRGRPKNLSSKAAKSHLGKWLFCAKKPPKTEYEQNECTHHQRKHVKNAKLSLFEKDNDGLVISMDDKAYLRPGTDVGMRDVRAGKIYDVTDPERSKKLPQHDFSNSQVHVTPSSFRFMSGHQEVIEGKTHPVNDVDQTVVTVRPKHYIGSSGSVWASDTMLLRRELPQLFEAKEGPYQYYSLPLRRLCAHIHDCLFYFEATTMKQDVMAITPSSSCKFREYEISRVVWLQKQLSNALSRFEEEKPGVQDVELALGNELKDLVTVVLDSVTEELQNIGTFTKEKMWQMHESLLKEIGKAQKYIKELKLPPVKADILKLTDAGPGVGCSNVEVRFRDAEMARIMRSDRVNRIHRARDDSEQNEAERSNACIGEALVDDGPLKWRYYEAFHNLTKEEIDELSLEDVKKREEEALEKNAWQVAKDVVERIQHEPGPGHDFMQSFLTQQVDLQFFFNTEQLRQFASSAESKHESVPGFAYFKKINVFLKQHMQVGELYLEFLKGQCQQTTGATCAFCVEFPSLVDALGPIPRPIPDDKAFPDLRYLPYSQTPVETSDGRREVDDFQPRAHIKKQFEQEVLSLDNEESIKTFSKTYAVQAHLIRKYVEHLNYLKIKRAKRADERRRKTEAQSRRTYDDYNWVEMFHFRTLSKCTVAVLDLFLKKHSLSRKGMNKRQKVQVITAWLANSDVNFADQDDARGEASEAEGDIIDTTDEFSGSDTEEEMSGFDTNEDVVLGEVGYSTADEESDTCNQPLLVNTRVGRTATTYHSRHFFGDSD